MSDSNKIVECMLTTIDNPFDPFDQFNDWFLFDVSHQYNSCGLLSRIAKTSECFSYQQNMQEIEYAIDEIIKNDIFDVYKKVSRTVTETQLASESV